MRFGSATTPLGDQSRRPVRDPLQIAESALANPGAFAAIEDCIPSCHPVLGVRLTRMPTGTLTAGYVSRSSDHQNTSRCTTRSFLTLAISVATV